jgi:hypothetical protein
MAKNSIKLAHHREVLRLRVQRQQARIAIADHKDRIAQIDTKLSQMKPKGPPASS